MFFVYPAPQPQKMCHIDQWKSTGGTTGVLIGEITGQCMSQIVCILCATVGYGKLPYVLQEELKLNLKTEATNSLPPFQWCSILFSSSLSMFSVKRIPLLRKELHQFNAELLLLLLYSKHIKDSGGIRWYSLRLPNVAERL